MILDILHGQIYRLNFVGSRMLELLTLGCTESQIAAQICLEFRAPQEIVGNDVREFIAHLQRHHLIEFGQPASDPLR